MSAIVTREADLATIEAMAILVREAERLEHHLLPAAWSGVYLSARCRDCGVEVRVTGYPPWLFHTDASRCPGHAVTGVRR